MKLLKSFTIDSQVVTPLRQNFLGYELYSHIPEEGIADEEVVYFVKDGEVKGKIKASADVGQGMGYISELTFKSL